MAASMVNAAIETRQAMMEVAAGAIVRSTLAHVSRTCSGRQTHYLRRFDLEA